MPVIWRPGPWVTAALRTGAPSAALSRGGSYWAHRFFGSEIENQNNWAGQVHVVPLFWSLGVAYRRLIPKARSPEPSERE